MGGSTNQESTLLTTEVCLVKTVTYLQMSEDRSSPASISLRFLGRRCRHLPTMPQWEALGFRWMNEEVSTTSNTVLHKAPNSFSQIEVRTNYMWFRRSFIDFWKHVCVCVCIPSPGILLRYLTNTTLLSKLGGWLFMQVPATCIEFVNPSL